MLREYFRRAYRVLIPYLYAKTNYKLFLQRTFHDLDQRISELLCTVDILPNIIKPIPIKAPFGRSILVIAPHQDDEIIGCGGSILLQIQAGKKVNIVFVQDGGDEYKEDGYSSREELVRIREKEAVKVAYELSIPNPLFLRHTVLDEKNISVVASELLQEIIRTDADVIFSPFILDHNSDHRMVNFALAEAIISLKNKPKILGYEVWGLCIPNVVVNIDRVMSEKQRLLTHYSSQLSGTDYVNCTTGINMYHSRTFGTGVCKYAEMFFEIPSNEFVEIVKKLRAKSILRG